VAGSIRFVRMGSDSVAGMAMAVNCNSPRKARSAAAALRLGESVKPPRALVGSSGHSHPRPHAANPPGRPNSAPTADKALHHVQLSPAAAVRGLRSVPREKTAFERPLGPQHANLHPLDGSRVYEESGALARRAQSSAALQGIRTERCKPGPRLEPSQPAAESRSTGRPNNRNRDGQPLRQQRRPRARASSWVEQVEWHNRATNGMTRGLERLCLDVFFFKPNLGISARTNTRSLAATGGREALRRWQSPVAALPGKNSP